MARSRRSSAPAPARKPATSTAKPAKTAPAPPPTTSAAPVPAAPSQGGGMMGGLMSTVAEGFAFGTGSAIARQAVNSVVDSFSSSDKEAPAPVAAAAAAAPPAATADVCFNDNKSFMDCLSRSANDISACQFYLDALNQCKQQSAYM